MLRDWSQGGWIDAVMAQNGVLGAHALEGDPQFGQQPTAEKTFRESRGDRDVTVEFALLVEGFDRDPVQQAAGTVAEKLRAEIACDVLTTLYRTQHVISNADVTS